MTGLRLTALCALACEAEVIISMSDRATVEHLSCSQSLLKATSDFAPSRFATDSGSVEGKLGRCVVAVGNDGS